MESIIELYCKKLKIGRVFYQDYKEIQAHSHEAFLMELLKRELEHREIIRKKRLLLLKLTFIIEISITSIWVANLLI